MLPRHAQLYAELVCSVPGVAYVPGVAEESSPSCCEACLPVRAVEQAKLALDGEMRRRE